MVKHRPHRSITNRHGGHAMKRVALFVLLLAVSAFLFGCGETVSGVGKDVNRMGRGVSTFFFRQP